MTQEILDQLNKIKTEHAAKKIVQDQEKDKKGKYKHIPQFVKDENDISYRVNAYECPNGEVGFDILFKATIGEAEYSKSICYGQEAEDRQHDWVEVVEDIIN